MATARTTAAERLRETTGQSLVLFAVVFSACTLLLVVVVDATHAFDKRRGLQNAADAAALAVAFDMAHGISDTNHYTFEASTLSDANDGPGAGGTCAPDDVKNCSIQECAPDRLTNCWQQPYNDGKVDHPDEVEVRLFVPCVGTLFGNLTSFLTATHAFDCRAESAHAIAAVTPGNTRPRPGLAALMGDGENDTLFVNDNSQLKTNDTIYVNACAKHTPDDGSCPGPAAAQAMKVGTLGVGSFVSAPQIQLVGAWNSACVRCVTVGSRVATDPNYDPSESPCNSTGYAPPQTDHGCPLTGQPALQDPNQDVPTLRPGHSAGDRGLTVSANIRTFQRSGNIATIYLDSMPPGLTHGTPITVDGTSDDSFNGDYHVTGCYSAPDDTSLTCATDPDPTKATDGHSNWVQVSLQTPFTDTVEVTGAPGKLFVDGPGSDTDPEMLIIHSDGTMTNPLPGWTVDQPLPAGTYYGGICIGAPPGATDCTATSTTSCDVGPFAESALPNVHLLFELEAGSSTLPPPTVVFVSGRFVNPGDILKLSGTHGDEWLQVTKTAPYQTGDEKLTVSRGYRQTTPIDFLKAGTTFTLEQPTGDAVHIQLEPNARYIVTGGAAQGSGGLYVCGNSSLVGSNDLIFSTDDKAGNGDVGRIEFNTTGTVSLTPYTSDPYAGLTIYENRNVTYNREIPQITLQHPNAPAYTPPLALTSTLQLPAPGDPETTFTYGGGNEIRVGDIIKIDNEVMFVRAVAGPTVTVVRTYLPGPFSRVGIHVPGAAIWFVSFQDPDGRKTCANKKADPSLWDIALMAMGSSGDGGALGSISGTIYAPGPRAVFGVQASGSADLSVFASCISINGADASFQLGPADPNDPPQISLTG